MLLASVVIPNYNGKEYLKACLDSLPKGESYEIIVVDNGSSDGSAAMVEQEFPGVCLIRNDCNEGFDAAVNAGIRKASAEYVILLNNDTTVDESFLQALVDGLDRHPECFSASSCMVTMKDPEILDDTGDYYCVLGWAFTLKKGKKRSTRCREQKCFAACGGASIYRKKVFDRIGLFDENHFAYLEDIDIGFRAQIAGYRNIYIPEAVCRHVGSGFSGSRYNSFKIKLSAQNSIYLIYKNMPLLMLLINLPFLLVGHLVKFVFFLLKGHAGDYLAGIGKGFRLSFSRQGRAKKVPFRWRHLGQYCRIQWNLWVNLIRRFINY